jgi:hypothetical protein
MFAIIPLIPDFIVLIPVAYFVGKLTGKHGRKRR